MASEFDNPAKWEETAGNKGENKGARDSGSTKLKKLTPLHKRAALILLQTGSNEETAKQCGVSKQTVSKWKSSRKFKEYFSKLRRRVWDEALVLLQGNAKAVLGKLLSLVALPIEDEYLTDEDGEIARDDRGRPIVLRQGRADIVLNASRLVVETNFKWVSEDVLERLDKLEQRLAAKE